MGTLWDGASSAPSYPFQRSGPVLVCGSAWTLSEDYRAARVLYPGAPVIAINGAAGEVPCFAMFSQHPLNMPRWIAWQRERFGTDAEVHASGHRHLRNRLGVKPDLSWVDYWWEGIASNGSSAWGGRRLAAALGFDEVILCGVPLSPGPYAYADVSKLNSQESVMHRYRSAIEADTAFHAGVRSMSGFTRDLFGAPS